MAGITLAQAEAQLATWMDALTKVASGQRVRVGERELYRANLPDVQKMVEFWDAKVKELTPSGARTITIRAASPR